MSGSSQNRESPHFYIVILHAGAVLKDFMPYPAPDGVAADFLRAGDAAAEGDIQRIPFQGAELIADAPPVVAAQGDAAVLDDRAAVGTVIAPGQHGVRALFHIVLCHAVRLFHGDVAVVHDGAGLIAYHTENGLAILRTDGAILHPDVCGAALPQRDEPHRTSRTALDSRRCDRLSRDRSRRFALLPTAAQKQRRREDKGQGFYFHVRMFSFSAGASYAYHTINRSRCTAKRAAARKMRQRLFSAFQFSRVSAQDWQAVMRLIL